MAFGLSMQVLSELGRQLTSDLWPEKMLSWISSVESTHYPFQEFDSMTGEQFLMLAFHVPIACTEYHSVKDEF